VAAAGAGGCVRAVAGRRVFVGADPAGDGGVAFVARGSGAGPPAGEAGGSMVEIALPNGCRLRVPAAIDGAALRRLVTVLKTAV
jgi:hypothetical protein